MLPGIGAGEEGSRFDFGNVELIYFDYRPAVVNPLVPTNTGRLLPGRAAMYTPVQ